MPKTPPRSHLLHLAETYVTGHPSEQSGEKNRDYLRATRMWNAHISGVLERKLDEWLRTSDAKPSVTREEFVETLQQDVLDDALDSWDVAWMLTYFNGAQSTVDPFDGVQYSDSAATLAVGYDCTVEAIGEDWADGELKDFAQRQADERAEFAQSFDARTIMERRAAEERAAVDAIQAERATGSTTEGISWDTSKPDSGHP